MSRLLKYIISIVLICVPGYMLYRGLVDFVATPAAPAKPAVTQNKTTPAPTPNPTPTPTPTPKIELLPIKIKTASKEIAINAEVADTEQERSYGLMNRTSLPKDQGMIFVYEKEMMMIFWMKNTLIPLDIIFIGVDKKVVSTETMPPCKNDPCPVYTSRSPSQYAIEVNAGFVKENGIRPGDGVDF